MSYTMLNHIHLMMVWNDDVVTELSGSDNLPITSGNKLYSELP